MLQAHRKVRTYAGGIIDRAEQLQIEMVPTFGAWACPSGVITAEAHRAMKGNLLAGISAAGTFDAVFLSLHGAGVTEETEDLEGDIILAVRAQIGTTVPLVVTLDLHANMTQLMVQEADLIIGDNFYPHIDSYERGQEAVDLAVRLLNGDIRPVMHLTQIPLMVSPMGTAFYPMSRLSELCREHELTGNVIDCTFYHGFPYADIWAAGCSVLTTTNGDKLLAGQISEQVAETALSLKRHFYPKHPGPDEGISLALASPACPVIINETSDNPGGGAPGDGTHLLREMIDRKLHNACFAFICDPETANAVHEAGAGRHIDIRLGGKTDPLHGAPLSLHAYVKAITDGKFVTSSPMGKGNRLNLGKSARLVVDGIDIIVCSVNNQVFDEQIFLLHGIDVRQYKIVALKSSHHFRAAFELFSDTIITVDSPGLSTVDFTGFPFRHVRRPIYPLDRTKD